MSVTKRPNVYYLKSSTSCLRVFYISLFDSDDSGMDEDWRLITVTTAQADEACITLDKLIRNGVISKERIFYKYLNHFLPNVPF